VALRTRAAECWFCSAPLGEASAPPRLPAGSADADEDVIAFARGFMVGAAVVLVPLAIRLTLLAVT
jgi:hypothetical protein